MRALVVEPAAVVELVAQMLVVAHVARRLRRVARPGAPDADQARPVGRPLKARDAVQQRRDAPRLAPAERQQPYLRAGRTVDAACGGGGRGGPDAAGVWGGTAPPPPATRGGGGEPREKRSTGRPDSIWGSSTTAA